MIPHLSTFMVAAASDQNVTATPGSDPFDPALRGAPAIHILDSARLRPRARPPCAQARGAIR